MEGEKGEDPCGGDQGGEKGLPARGATGWREALRGGTGIVGAGGPGARACDSGMADSRLLIASVRASPPLPPLRPPAPSLPPPSLPLLPVSSPVNPTAPAPPAAPAALAPAASASVPAAPMGGGPGMGGSPLLPSRPSDAEVAEGGADVANRRRAAHI